MVTEAFAGTIGGVVAPGAEIARIAPEGAGQPHHTAFILIDGAALPEELRILPGMAAQADIVAGQKTLLDYLFRPMQDPRERLFSQR